MALTFDDKRARYRGLNADQFQPGTPNHANPATIGQNRHEIARRNALAPRDAFRTTTRELTAEEQAALLNPPAIEIKPAWNAIPEFEEL